MFTRRLLMQRISRFTGEQQHFFSGRKLPDVRIERMAPSITSETIRHELETEIQENGIEKLQQTLKKEQVALQQLQTMRQEYLDRIKEACISPLQKRITDGYNIAGIFWNKQQEKLNQIVPKEQFNANEEAIDWLKTRQVEFAKLFKSYSSDKTERFLAKI